MVGILGEMKLNNWKEDKKWSDRFLPEVKMILGLHLIGEPPIEEDIEHNTDLIILKMEAVRIACRIRHKEYFEKYPNEITIRTNRPSGAKTELAKIIEGWGDYFFYGFANEDETKLYNWKLCKLNAFRLYFNSFIVKQKGEIPGIEKINKDRSSSFRAFNTLKIPDFVIAQKQT